MAQNWLVTSLSIKLGRFLGRFSEFVANFYLIQSLYQHFQWMTRLCTTNVTLETTLLSLARVTCLATSGDMEVKLVERADRNTDKNLHINRQGQIICTKHNLVFAAIIYFQIQILNPGTQGLGNCKSKNANHAAIQRIF